MMQYTEIKPSERALHLIEKFWFYSCDFRTTKFKIFPDGCIDFIIDLSTETIFISGIMSRSETRSINNPTYLIGIQLKAEHFHMFSNVSAYELRNLRLEIPYATLGLNKSTLGYLFKLETNLKKAHFLEAILLQNKNISLDKNSHFIVSIANKIRLFNGNCSVYEIQKTSDINIRTLERCFKRNVGLTMKEFARIIRFENCKKLIKNSDINFTDIAYDFGYYDLAHMNKEFRLLTGENPSYFQ